MSNATEFGTALRAARLAAGMTQRQVAAVMGTSGAYVARVEGGWSSPLSLARIVELSAIFPATSIYELLVTRSADLVCDIPAEWWPEVASGIHDRLTARVSGAVPSTREC